MWSVNGSMTSVINIIVLFTTLPVMLVSHVLLQQDYLHIMHVLSQDCNLRTLNSNSCMWKIVVALKINSVADWIDFFKRKIC